MSKNLTTPFVAAVAVGLFLVFAAVHARPAAAGTVELAEATEMPTPLTKQAGDPAKGKGVLSNRKLGNCLACHQLEALKEQPFHGEVGPPLDGVASRYSVAELRLRVVDPKALNPDTIMPSFYKTEGLHRVMKKFQGKPILTAQQVEDLLAYLATLKD